MTVPVWVERQNGRFTAYLAAAPNVRADGATREAAVDSLFATIAPRHPGAELLFVNPDRSAAAPTPYPPCTPEETEAWRAVVADIYRERDEEKRREFGE